MRCTSAAAEVTENDERKEGKKIKYFGEGCFKFWCAHALLRTFSFFRFSSVCLIADAMWERQSVAELN